MIELDNGEALIIGADNPVELDRLFDAWDAANIDGSKKWINDATVTFTLKSGSYAGSTIASGTLSYVAGSNGKYRGVIEDDVALIDGTTYYEEVTADCGADRIQKFRCKRLARY